MKRRKKLEQKLILLGRNINFAAVHDVSNMVILLSIILFV